MNRMLPAVSLPWMLWETLFRKAVRAVSGPLESDSMQKNEAGPDIKVGAGFQFRDSLSYRLVY